MRLTSDLNGIETMKCERCGSELQGTSIMCPRCRHNNARQVVNNWRSKQVSMPSRSTAEKESAPAESTPKIKPRGDADDNLLRFPISGSETAPATTDDWRSQVKEKVRLARLKRQADEDPEPAAGDQKNLEQNPIVQAALNRIKWTSPAAPVRTTYGSGRGATALAEAIEPMPEAEPFPDPVSEPVKPPKPARNPFITTRQTKPASDIGTRPRAEARPSREIPASRPVIPPKTAPAPEPKPDLISYADVSPVKPAPSVIPPPPVIPPKAPEQPKVEEPAEPKTVPEFAPEATPIHTESNGTQVIGISSIMGHLYEMAPTPASMWVRILAGGCDLEILAMAFLPIFAAYAMLNTSLGTEALFILGILLSALVFVYQSVCLQIAERTIGMALLNLKLINTGDETLPITRKQIMLRAWGATIAFLFPPLNLIVMKANRRGLSLPDLISGTSPVDRR